MPTVVVAPAVLIAFSSRRCGVKPCLPLAEVVTDRLTELALVLNEASTSGAQTLVEPSKTVPKSFGINF